MQATSRPLGALGKHKPNNKFLAFKNRLTSTRKESTLSKTINKITKHFKSNKRTAKINKLKLSKIK